MKMRYIFTILIFSISFFTYGQDLDGYSVRVSDVPLDSLPKYVIKMNEVEYLLDSVPDSIKPNWIERIEVLKREEQNIYGNDNGVVLIYPKKKYFEQINKLFKATLKNQEPIDKQTLDSIYFSCFDINYDFT